MARSSAKWAIRKVKDGRVKIYGRWYRPSPQHDKYDGRCDGISYLFGRYEEYGEKEKFQPFVNCWGRVENMNDPEMRTPDPKVMPDGTLPWEIWYAEDIDANDPKYPELLKKKEWWK